MSLRVWDGCVQRRDCSKPPWRAKEQIGDSSPSLSWLVSGTQEEGDINGDDED